MVRPQIHGTAWRFSLTVALSLLAIQLTASHSIGESPAVNSPSVNSPATNSPAPIIDQWISTHWQETNCRPAPVCSDDEFVRRLYLDVAGRIPTRTEWTNFRADTGLDKRQRLIDQLLASDEYAVHFANQWNAHLLGRTVFPPPAEWWNWLRGSIASNKSWQLMAREMLLARPSTEGDRGASEFLIRRLSQAEPLDDVTRDVTRLFFGVDMQCARCHTHPEIPEWEPESYWGMAAFFSRSYLVDIDGRKHVAERSRGDATYVVLETKESRTARAQFMTGTCPPSQAAPSVEPDERIAARKASHPDAKPGDPLLDDPDEYVIAPAAKPVAPSQPKYSLRAELAQLAIEQDNPYFARSVVNRVWAWLMGRGLVEPLDQLHAANEPIHPELLQAITADFVAHHYDLRRLIRGIISSDAYQRASVHLYSIDKRGSADSYAQAPLKPLSPHQWATAILCALGQFEQVKTRAEFDAQHMETLGALAKRLDCGSELFQPDLPLALYLANNEQFAATIAAGPLTKSLCDMADHDPLIRTAFEAIVSRSPDADEMAIVRSYLAARGDRREQACQGLVWSLITSSEFRFNH